MPDRLLKREAKMRVTAGVVLGLLLAVGMAGCAAADGGGGAEPGGTATSSAQPDQLKFARCMRENGIDLPDPAGDGGAMTVGPEQADKQKVDAATQLCRQFMPNGGDREKADPQRVEQMRQLAKCLRENGLPDFPDPDANGDMGVPAGSGIDPNDPTFKAAQRACEKYQPAPPSAGGNR